MAIFSDMVEEIMEVFMDDFSVFGTSFDHCLHNLARVLQRCEERIWFSIGKSAISLLRKELFWDIEYQ